MQSISTVVSALPATVPPTSSPMSATAVSLPVPGYSQMIHRGQSPQYGGGGEAWCSPTSLSMLLRFWGAEPVAGWCRMGTIASLWVSCASAELAVPSSRPGEADRNYGAALQRQRAWRRGPFSVPVRAQ